MTTEHGKASGARPFRQGKALVNRQGRVPSGADFTVISFDFSAGLT
jgi:hypothetical protein